MRKCFVWLLLGIILGINAETKLIPDMKFRRLDTRHGLSHSEVTCIMTDSRGFTWLGTPYGLNRYDGYRVKTFYSNIRDTTSMRDNRTDLIYEAYDGRLWLKQNMNYCIYDPVTESFVRNIGPELAKMGISGGVDRIFIDSKKNFWVKLYDVGIYYYNPHTKKLNLFKAGYESNQINPTYGVSTFVEEGDNVLFTTNCGEIVCLNGEQGAVVWESKWIRENGGRENQDYKLTVDHEGNYWVVTTPFTYVYVKKEKHWYRSVSEYLKAKGFENTFEDLAVWGVAEDRHNWIWLATDHQGVIVFDPQSKQIKQFLSNKYDETTISENTLRHLYLDPKGQMWVASYKNGVCQYVESLQSFYNVDALGDVNIVLEDKHGLYWVGTNDRGIIVYNPKTGEQLRNYTVENSGLSGNIMVGGYTASDGSLWFGSYNGGLVHCIPSASDPAQATIVNYRATGKPDDLSNNSVWGITEDKWQRIWVTTLGGGVQMLDLKTGKFKTYNTKNTSLPSDYLNTITWTSKGWILLGTSYYYSLLNPVSGKLVNMEIPESPNVQVAIFSTIAVAEDSRGLIWQGSTSGICIYDPKTKQVDLLDMTKGLYGSSVASIAEDQQHTMWVVTDHGVSNIVPQKQADGSWQYNVRSFNSRDGLQQATYNQRSNCITKDGLLLIGGQGGLDIINPSQIASGKTQEKPIFSGLQLFDQEVPVGKEINGRVILDEALNECREIDLYFNDQFTIELSSDAGRINNGRRFAYRLEGFNENWVRTSELNPNITYNSLRAGSYTLHVRMLNDDGTIGDEESTLDITIHPPLWRTRWAVLLYMLIIVVAALIWRRWFMRKQQERAELEQIRRETDKQRWMSEMKAQMQKEQGIAIQQAKETVMQGGDELVEPVVEQVADGSSSSSQKEEADIVGFVRDQCRNFKLTDGKKFKLSFNSNVDALNCLFNAEQLGRVLTILISNAVKFSPSGSRIQVTVISPNPKRVNLLVADNGIGIEEKAKVHMFDPVLEGDDTIGLYQVKQIVDAHGGDIHAENNPGGGTVFVIGLPVDAIEEAEIIEEN